MKTTTRPYHISQKLFRCVEVMNNCIPVRGLLLRQHGEISKVWTRLRRQGLNTQFVELLHYSGQCF